MKSFNGFKQFIIYSKHLILLFCILKVWVLSLRKGILQFQQKLSRKARYSNCPVYLLTEGLRYAETWDFEVSASSFLQFDLSTGCSKTVTPSNGVHLEFSTDFGHQWTLVTSECVPPAIGCARYTQSSIYSTPQYSQWRRVTVYLPSVAKYAIYTFLSM